MCGMVPQPFPKAQACRVLDSAGVKCLTLFSLCAHTHMNLRNVCFAAVVVVVPKGGHGVIKQVNTSPKFTQRNGSLAAGPLVSVKRDICCLCFPDLIGIWKLMKWF